MTHKYVYLFSEGDASMRNLLGGKGANLAEMKQILRCTPAYAASMAVTRPR